MRTTWRLRPSLLHATRQEVRERVQRIRAARRGVRWSRPLGLVLIAVAILAALDADYPVLPADPHSSTKLLHHLVPQLVEPVGHVGRPVEAFRWRWAPSANVDATQPCALVLLDEGLSEVHREEVSGGECPVGGRLAEVLSQGSQFHWFVEVPSAVHENTVVSTPAAFGFLP